MIQKTFIEALSQGFPPQLVADEFLRQNRQRLEECAKRGAVGIYLTITETEAMAEGFIEHEGWLEYTTGLAAIMEDADGSDEGGKEFKEALDHFAREGDVPIVLGIEQPDGEKGVFFYRSTMRHVRTLDYDFQMTGEDASDLVEKLTGVRAPGIVRTTLPNDSNGATLRDILSRSGGSE